MEEAGVLTLSNDSLWSDLRSGTIITITEWTTAETGLDTDASYDPSTGDWWINVNSFDSQYITTTTNVQGAIVKPATRSNHLVGHAIDMNVQFGPNRTFANSSVLRQFPNVPPPVAAFLQAVIDDPDLRWGGQFSTKDPVHIDDGLNLRNRAKWDQRYALLQQTAQGLR